MTTPVSPKSNSWQFIFFFILVINLFFFSGRVAAQHDTLKAKLLIDSALAVEFTDNSLAKKLAQEGLRLASQTQNSRLRSSALTVLGYLHEDLSDFNTASEYYLKSLEVNIKSNNKKKQGLDYNNLGLNYENRGDYIKALDFHNQALIIRIQVKDSIGIAGSYNNIGNVYGRQGNLEKSLGYFLLALKINEQTGQTRPAIAQLNNIGIIYKRLKNFPKALEYETLALEKWEKTGQQPGIIIAHLNISALCFDNNMFEKAKTHSLSALRISEGINDKSHVAQAYNMLGAIHSMEKNYDTALVYLKKGLTINKELHDNSDIVQLYCNLASIYIETNSLAQAKLQLDQALPIARANNSHLDIKEIYKYYYKCYKAGGDLKNALKFHELFMMTNDTIYNIESTKRLNELNTKYETEKKESMNKLLQTENALVSKTNKQQKLVLYGIGAGLLLVIALAFFIFKSLKQQRRANFIISAQKTEVEKQRDIINVQKHEVESQKHLIEEKNKEMLDSIHYAERIQHALLASDSLLNQNLQQDEHFVYFRPKDIVSGDFYWATEHENRFYLAVCDSTGHGVPGAFMSLLNMGFLSEGIKEKDLVKPNEILNYVRQRLIDSISKEGQKDGFDGILLCIDKTNHSYTYAAAFNAPLLVNGEQITSLECDKMPVGKGERTDSFNLYTLDVKKGDTVYLYTDGYADQFGGPKGKKFKYKQLNTLLQVNSVLPAENQEQELNRVFEEWKGPLEQVDDVLVIGIRI